MVNKDDDKHQDIIQDLLNTPLEIEDFVPLSREELYERNQDSIDSSTEMRVASEKKSNQPGIVNQLSNNPISVRGMSKLTREDLHNRTL